MVLSRQNLTAGPGQLPIFSGVIPADAALRGAGKKAKQIQNKAAAKVGTEKSGRCSGNHSAKSGYRKLWASQVGSSLNVTKKDRGKRTPQSPANKKMREKNGREEKGGAAAFVAVDCERRRRSYGHPKAIYRAHPWAI